MLKKIIDPNCYTTICFQDNNIVYIGGLTQGEIIKYNINSNEVIERITGKFNFPKQIMISDKFLIISDYWTKGFFVWELETLKRFKEQYYNEYMQKITCFDLSKKNNNLLAYGMLTSVVNIIDLSKRVTLFWDELHVGRITDLIFTPDGNKLISVSEDSLIIVRNVE